MKLRFLFAFSLLVCSYLFYHWISKDNNENQEEFIETVPNYVSHNLKTTTFNVNGLPYRELLSNEVQFYEYLGTSYMIRPNMTYFPNQDMSRKSSSKNQDSAIWTLMADYGIVNANDNLNLRGNILGHTTDKESVVTDITGQYLEYDLNTQDIRTNEPITLSGRALNDTCSILNGNLQTQYFLLEDNCNATYSMQKNSTK